MKNTNTPLRSLALVLALCAGSAFGQLIYNPVATPTLFANMKADGAFVANTLLNLGTFAPVPDFDGQLHSFSFAGLTFNNIPNLDVAPSDIQVGPGFFADVTFLAKDSADVNNIGSEASLLGASNQVLFAGYGAGSTQSVRITANAATDVIFWHQDTSWDNIKYTMNDMLHFTTFTASDVNFQYYIFGIDDRGTVLQDFDDGVFGVRLNLQPVGDILPVPEPSTYGLVGAFALLGAVAYRRVKTKAAAVG
jgi:hypothetical protein